MMNFGRLSRNFDKKKRLKRQIKLIVFHYTGMQSKVEALRKLYSSKSKVSCHYFIDEIGNITKIVPEKFSAWHAGKSGWKNFKFLNKFSVGIELVNPGHDFGYRKFSKKQIHIAKKYKAYAVSHGSTGKGNDQVRFELGYHYFGPKIKVIAPWRIWKLNSRTDLIKYAKKNKIPIPKDKKGAPPFSVDDNLFHTSTEGKVLENPKNQAPEFIYQRTTAPEKAPNKTSYVTIGFKNGDPISLNKKHYSPSKLLEKLNSLAGKNGVGRVDLVENRFIGIKSRGIYETPGGTVLIFAHRAIESITLDNKTMHAKDKIMPRYAELIYNGFWFSKERLSLQKIIDQKKARVEGEITIKLYKGSLSIVGRKSKKSIYSKEKSSFEGGKIFSKKYIENFIKNAAKKLKK